jgi:NB-ARC domain/Tetratricopeptide repeat
VPQFSKEKWPPDGPVRTLLAYLDRLHRQAGQPSLTEMGKEVALAPSTLSAFFTGTRLISRGNLELLVSHLGGDVERAEQLRRKAVTAWYAAGAHRPASGTAGHDVPKPTPVDESQAAERVDVIVYDTPVNKLNRPEQLLGRADLSAQVHTLLDAGQRVLLYGLAGSGKTALAATVADARVGSGLGPYLWLRTSTADEEVALDAVLRRLTSEPDQQRIRSAVGDARLLAIQDVIARSEVSLCVLDDVWNVPALHTILQAVPGGMAVLITSRFKIDVPHRIEVDDLEPAAATLLLATHSRQEMYAGDPQAEALCRELGNHAYAIEIAGHHLSQYALTPAELRAQIAGGAHELPMPAGFSAPGRESVKRLLDQSLSVLNHADAQLVLSAFGAFFSGGATVELLTAYLGISPTRVRAALHRLVDLTLAQRQQRTSFYTVHDLTFSYARALHAASVAKPGGVGAVIEAARAFVAAHAKNFDVLGYDLDNVLGATARATQSDVDAVLAIVEGLATSGYLDGGGVTIGLLRLLDHAIEVLRDRPGEPTERLHLLLSKRGNAHYNQGEKERAVAVYRQAEALAPNPRRAAVLQSVIGKVLVDLGERTLADQQFRTAYELAEANHDDEGMLLVLEQHSIAVFRQGDYTLVRDITTRGLEISRRLGDRGREAAFLNNLGSAEFELGVRASLAHHEQARAIAAELGDSEMLALTHRTIGIDHHAREDYPQASTHLGEALRRYRDLGHTETENKLCAMMRTFGYMT